MIISRRPPSKGAMAVLSVVAVIIAAVMIGSGIFLLVQRQTGPRASATVGDCVSSGGGRWPTVHCTGSWVVGGSLLEGGHVVVGTIDGADTGDVGKTLDVTLRGDTAYTRGLALPLLLIGIGFIPAAALVLRIRTLARAARNGREPSGHQG
jgi:hypothetical protein